MKIFNRICSVVVVFSMAFFIVSFAQNMLLRSSSVYAFYFNDSQAVDSIYTELSNAEMAEAIAGFMNSWRPDRFEVLEDTGYDKENIFTEEEGENMMKVKQALDISGLLCVVSFILTASIYFHFLRDGKKKVLFDAHKFSLGLVVTMGICEAVFMSTHGGRKQLLSLIGIAPLHENSQLLAILGADFIHMATVFLVVLTLIVTIIMTYISYALTKPPRIFY